MGFTPNTILSLCAVICHPCAQKMRQKLERRVLPGGREGYHYLSGSDGRLRITPTIQRELFLLLITPLLSSNLFYPFFVPPFFRSLPSRSGSCPRTAAWCSSRWTTTPPTTGRPRQPRRGGDTRRTPGKEGLTLWAVLIGTNCKFTLYRWSK